MPHDYSAREVAELLGLSLAEVRRCAKAGFLAAREDERGEARFSFQDLVLLRSAAKLISRRVRPHRVRHALSKLRAQIPGDRPLSGVLLSAEGAAILAHDGKQRWDPLSGQLHLDFARAEPAPAAPLVSPEQAALEAEALYDRGCALEEAAPSEAEAAYRLALRADPDHLDARINLGRLLHESGRLAEAEVEYRRVLAVQPSALAAFNLGVALEDLGRVDDAVAAYQLAVTTDARCEDAYFNLARIHERRGDRPAALRALRTYRALTRH
jgi:tetratricopeptide (TPR) repeat protein